MGYGLFQKWDGLRRLIGPTFSAELAQLHERRTDWPSLLLAE